VTDFEKLGAFYLGKRVGTDDGALRHDELVLYDAKDLTTHAVCVGMTGSGKTGLCVSLLEEAAIDGIPAIVIDPKGDLGNLALTLPGAARRGLPALHRPERGAAARADARRSTPARPHAVAQGLADWGQDGERIRRCATPPRSRSTRRAARSAGPVDAALARGAARGAARRPRRPARARAGRGRGLLGCSASRPTPCRAASTSCLSNLLDSAWRNGEDLDLADLIAASRSRRSRGGA
jgi:hypothetical protein